MRCTHLRLISINDKQKKQNLSVIDGAFGGEQDKTTQSQPNPQDLSSILQHTSIIIQKMICSCGKSCSHTLLQLIKEGHYSSQTSQGKLYQLCGKSASVSKLLKQVWQSIWPSGEQRKDIWGSLKYFRPIQLSIYFVFMLAQLNLGQFNFPSSYVLCVSMFPSTFFNVFGLSLDGKTKMYIRLENAHSSFYLIYLKKQNVQYINYNGTP